MNNEFNVENKNWPKSLKDEFKSRSKKHSKKVEKDFIGKLKFFNRLPIVTTIFAFAMSIVGIVYSSFYNIYLGFFIPACILFGAGLVFFVLFFKYIGKTKGNTNLVYLLSTAPIVLFAIEIFTSLNPLVNVVSDRILFGTFVGCFVVQLVSFLYYNCAYANKVRGNKLVRFGIFALLVVAFAAGTSYSAIEAFAYDNARFSVSEEGNGYKIDSIRGGASKKVSLNLEHDGKFVLLHTKLFDSTSLDELELNIPKDYAYSFSSTFQANCKLKKISLVGDYDNPDLIIDGFKYFTGSIYMDDDKFEMVTRKLHEDLQSGPTFSTSHFYTDFLSRIHSNQGTKFITYITFGTPYYFEPVSISNLSWYINGENFSLDNRVHVFDAWYKDLGCNTKYSSSDSFNDSTFVYGNWLKRYDINYLLSEDEKLLDKKGNVVDSSTVQHFLENETQVSLFSAEKEGYHFVGWSTNQSATSGVKELTLSSSSSYVDYKLYPVFEKIYNIKYMNGSEELTGLEPSTFYKSFGSFNVPTPNVTKVGYHYDGWDTTYAAYAANQTINLGNYNEDLTFLLRWMPNIYNLRFDSNGGSKVNDARVTYDSIVDFSTFNTTREGYNFLGWKLNDEFVGEYKWQIDGDALVQAQWEPIVYKVSFDSNEGTPVSDTTITYEDYPDFEAPTRIGYTFVGWFNGDTMITSSKKWNIPYDVTLIARWEANRYIASYDSNGGSELEDEIVYYDSYIALDEPTRKGYTFDYWMLDGSPVGSEFIWKYTEDTGFIAHWTPNIYKIIYMTSETTECNRVDAVFDTIPAGTTDPVRANYNFEGWLYEGQPIDLNQIYTFDHDITVYANWVGQERTIKFDSNGGSECEDVVVRYGESCTLPIPTRVGYFFNGWVSNHVRYNTNYTCDLSEDATFVADWIPHSYNVNFDANGGSLVSSRTAIYDSPFELPSASRTGYSFDGWFIDDVEYVNESIWKYASDKTAVAHWTPNNYMLSFDTDGGETIEPRLVTFDTVVNLPTPTKTGYDFVEWQYDSEKVDQTFKWQIPNGAEFKAIWKAREYNVNFDNEFSRIATYDSPFELPNAQMTGYTFDGWFIDDTQYIDGSIWKYTSDKYAVSHFTANQYTLFFDTDGGDAITSKKVTFDTIVDLPTPTKTGYDFVEWQYDSKKINNSFVWKFDKNVQVKAIWKAKQYNVDFGGVIKKATYGELFTLPAKPTKEGYDFEGWRINGNLYNEPFVWTIASDVTAVEVYNAKTFTVTFNSDGGSSVSPLTATYNVGFFLPEPPTKDGYDFAGWSFNGDVKTDTFIWKYTSNMTAVAQWTPKTFTVSFNVDGGNSISPVTATYGQNFALPTPEKLGSEFLRWELDGVEVENEFIWKYEEDKEFTAVWKKNKYTVAFDTSGGDFKSPVTLSVGDSYNFSDPTKEGYKFDGWINAVTKEPIPSRGSWSIADHVLLKATWVAKI